MATLAPQKMTFPGVNIPDADLDFLKPTPAHVPAELIRPYPFVLGATSRQPHATIVPAIHQGPELFWAERGANGIEGAWIPRTLALLHTIYNDVIHFSSRGSAPFTSSIAAGDVDDREGWSRHAGEEEALTILPEFALTAGEDVEYYLAAIAQPIEFSLSWQV